MVRIARVSRLMDQDGQRLSPNRLLPEAVAFKRERQLIVAAPMGQEPANRHGQIGWIVTKRERTRYRLFAFAGGIDDLLTKPHPKGKASVDPGFPSTFLHPGIAPVRAILNVGGREAV